MYSNIIADKSLEFSVDIVNLYKVLIEDKKEYILSKQLLRAGTSIGANIREWINGFSKADFKFMMSIALKEASETEYWLILLLKVSVIKEKEISNELQKCSELCKILYRIVKAS